jgi:hypothetical protein
MAATQLETTTPGHPRAKATLIFVPGLGHDTGNSAEVIATSIAGSASRYGTSVTVDLEKVPAATPGLRAVGSLVDAAGTRLLDVMELDYRENVEQLDSDDGKQGVGPALLVQGAYTLRAFGAILAGWGKHSKSKRAKFQLAWGTILMLLLGGVFLFTAYGFLATTLDAAGLDWKVTQWIDGRAKWLVASTGISVAAFTLMRKNLLRNARRIRQLMTYFDQQAAREGITRTLDVAIDRLNDVAFPHEIHVLGYSFGAVVALDCFTTDSAGDAPDGIDEVASLVTVGCIHDVVKLYRKDYFNGRLAHRPKLPWENVFVASDVLGSNFIPYSDEAQGDAKVFTNEWKVTSHRYLMQERLTIPGAFFKVAGLTQHNTYWDDEGGCWDLVLHRWGLARQERPEVAGG